MHQDHCKLATCKGLKIVYPAVSVIASFNAVVCKQNVFAKCNFILLAIITTTKSRNRTKEMGFMIITPAFAACYESLLLSVAGLLLNQCFPTYAYSDWKVCILRWQFEMA